MLPAGSRSRRTLPVVISSSPGGRTNCRPRSCSVDDPSSWKTARIGPEALTSMNFPVERLVNRSLKVPVVSSSPLLKMVRMERLTSTSRCTSNVHWPEKVRSAKETGSWVGGTAEASGAETDIAAAAAATHVNSFFMRYLLVGPDAQTTVTRGLGEVQP